MEIQRGQRCFWIRDAIGAGRRLRQWEVVSTPPSILDTPSQTYQKTCKAEEKYISFTRKSEASLHPIFFHGKFHRENKHESTGEHHGFL